MCTLENSRKIVPQLKGVGHTVFSADPVGNGVSVVFGIGVVLTFPCLHNIL